MAGVELNPGPITPADDKTVEKQEQAIPAPARNITEEEVLLLTEETEAKQFTEPRQEPSVISTESLHEEPAAPFLQPLGEPELVEFSEFITYVNQERIAVLLGSNIDKVEMLRSKHRENVTGVSIDLLIDWMRRNPQQTNRLVSINR